MTTTVAIVIGSSLSGVKLGGNLKGEEKGFEGIFFVFQLEVSDKISFVVGFCVEKVISIKQNVENYTSFRKPPFAEKLSVENVENCTSCRKPHYG